MSSRVRLLAAAWMLALPLAAGAQTVAYVSSFNTLYRVDLASGQAAEVGPIGFDDVEGLAFAPDGTLYGVSDGAEVLLRIDPANGHGTVVGGLGLAGQGVGQFNDLDFGLAFTCDGRLWLSSDTTGKLWQVDPSTGATTFKGSLGARITGLAGRGDALYGIGSQGDEALYRIDVASGAGAVIGRLGSTTFDDGGLDFDANGVLWGLFDFRPTQPNRSSDVARVDLGTGTATLVAKTLGEAEGLAIAPPGGCEDRNPAAAGIPVPTAGAKALAALAALCALLGALALRRRAA